MSAKTKALFGSFILLLLLSVPLIGVNHTLALTVAAWGGMCGASFCYEKDEEVKTP